MIKIISFILLSLLTTVFAQEDNSSVDIFVIDSYVTPEEPHKIILTFFTSENVIAKIKFDGNPELIVSKDYQEEHKFELLLNKLKYDSTSIPYLITVEKENGEKSISEKFDLYLPEDYNLEITNNSNFLDLCIGGVWYLIPSPTLTNVDSRLNYSLTKEFPLVSFYGEGYNFPSSYFSFEYSYLFDSGSTRDININRNFFRVGYKYIMQTEVIKYVSPGINLTTNFNGFNGISPEVSFGLFKFYETFTLYARYRYNYPFDSAYQDFHEISIGLFTSSISFNF